MQKLILRILFQFLWYCMNNFRHRFSKQFVNFCFRKSFQCECEDGWSGERRDIHRKYPPPPQGKVISANVILGKNMIKGKRIMWKKRTKNKRSREIEGKGKKIDVNGGKSQKGSIRRKFWYITGGGKISSYEGGDLLCKLQKVVSPLLNLERKSSKRNLKSNGVRFQATSSGAIVLCGCKRMGQWRFFYIWNWTRRPNFIVKWRPLPTAWKRVEQPYSWNQCKASTSFPPDQELENITFAKSSAWRPLTSSHMASTYLKSHGVHLPQVTWRPLTSSHMASTSSPLVKSGTAQFNKQTQSVPLTPARVLDRSVREPYLKKSKAVFSCKREKHEA